MTLERLDMFSASLPRKCLYCRFGYPVVFGTRVIGKETGNAD